MLGQPLKWHGGKSYLASWLHELAPPAVTVDPLHGYTHRNIVFAGGASEFWNWSPVEGVSESINDVNVELAAFYSVLRGDAYPQFVRKAELTQLSDEEFRRAKQGLASSPVDRAWEFFVRYRMSRQGLGKDYTTPTKRTRRGMNEQVSAWLSAVDGLTECHERLRRVEVRNLDCLQFIDAYDHPRALFYCDPPYVHGTRSSVGEFSHEMSDADHTALLTKLQSLQGKFMLSGYRSALYDTHATKHGWYRHDKEIDNKASSKAKKPIKTECVWTNYQPAESPRSRQCPPPPLPQKPASKSSPKSPSSLKKSKPRPAS